MATWLDLISLAVMLAITIGAIYAISIGVQQVSDMVTNTKETLKNKGVNISDRGVSVKTTQRFNREDYVDATQRGFIKAMGAASFGTAEGYEGERPTVSRQNSAAGSVQSVSGNSLKGDDGAVKKKRSFMTRKASH